MHHDHKKELRDLKRSLKKSGNKRRRQHWKRDLETNPEDAHHSEFDFGHNSSAKFNGIDEDRTRRRNNRDSDETPEK